MNRRTIDFIKNYLVTFINSKGEDEIYKSFMNTCNEGIPELYKYDGELKAEYQLKSNSELSVIPYPERIDLITSFHKLTNDIIRIALVKGYFEKNIDGGMELGKNLKAWSGETNRLEKDIKQILDYRTQTRKYTWRGMGECYPYQSNITENIYNNACYEIINIVVELFTSRFEYEIQNNDDEDMELEDNQTIINNGFSKEIISLGLGYKYFNVCPKCGKFFYKKRKDMVFDSEKCRAIVLQKRYIAKKKK